MTRGIRAVKRWGDWSRSNIEIVEARLRERGSHMLADYLIYGFNRLKEETK